MAETSLQRKFRPEPKKIVRRQKRSRNPRTFSVIFWFLLRKVDSSLREELFYTSTTVALQNCLVSRVCYKFAKTRRIGPSSHKCTQMSGEAVRALCRNVEPRCKFVQIAKKCLAADEGGKKLRVSWFFFRCNEFPTTGTFENCFMNWVNKRMNGGRRLAVWLLNQSYYGEFLFSFICNQNKKIRLA